MTTIALMRHGQAVPGDFQTPDDSRWLTQRGREDAVRAGTAMKALGIRFDAIVSSPLVRAVQTAELVAACLGWERPLVTMGGLRSEADPTRALDELKAMGAACVLAICHEPIVRLMATRLCESQGRGFQTAEVRVLSEGKCSWHHPN